MEKFHERVRAKKWPMFKHTAHRNRLSKGDKVIFYWGGKNNMIFTGTSELGSSLMEEDGLSHHVTLENSEVWKEPLPIKSITDDLEFIKEKTIWGGIPARRCNQNFRKRLQHYRFK